MTNQRKFVLTHHPNGMKCFEINDSCNFSSVYLSNAGEISIRYNDNDEISLDGDRCR